MNLFDMPNLLECGNAFMHDGGFAGAIIDLFYGNGRGVSCVNDALVVTNGSESTTFVKRQSNIS
jgi:hypothetical protein